MMTVEKQHNIADVMGVSEVLLCPYRCLEYKMERLEKQNALEDVCPAR